MPIGFIGTGAIAEAMVVGLREKGRYTGEMLLSARNRERSERLASRFDNVRVVEENQEIVDRADTVVVATLPKDAVRVLSPLSFRHGQTVISLVAEHSIERLSELVQPVTDIHRAIPMPPIEHGVGPTVLFPSSSAVEALFESVSTVVIAENEAEFDVFTAASSGMASFFDLVGSIATWMESEGIPESSSATYVTALFRALTSMARRKDAQQLKALSRECQTEGGLNEQVFGGCQRAGWADILTGELAGVLERVRRSQSAESAAD